MSLRKINLDMLYNNESIEIDLKGFMKIVLGGVKELTYKSYLFRLKKFLNYKIIDNNTIVEWNKIIENSKDWNNNTKNSTANMLCWLIKKINLLCHTSFDTSIIRKYQTPISKRTSLTDEEVDKIRIVLNEMNNKQFSLIFEILLCTGIRVNELSKINWELLPLNDWQTEVPTQKRNKPTIIIIPNYLRKLISETKIYYKTNTIKFLFFVLQKRIKQKYSDWEKPVFAHILRHTFITNLKNKYAYTNEEIQELVGYTTISVVNNYVHNRKENVLELRKRYIQKLEEMENSTNEI